MNDAVDSEWLEWYLMTPQQRWQANQDLWQSFFELGGTLDAEPDTQSPFFDEDEWRELSSDGGTGMRVVRRSGV